VDVVELGAAYALGNFEKTADGQPQVHPTQGIQDPRFTRIKAFGDDKPSGTRDDYHHRSAGVLRAEAIARAGRSKIGKQSLYITALLIWLMAFVVSLRSFSVACSPG
jgi:hypothetical protein